MKSTRTLISPSRAVIERLLKATNDHDLDALVDCFAVDYINETPAHPPRGFTGREQVRLNWRQIFAAVPDLMAEVTAWAEEGGAAWTEWQMSGTRGDGTRHLMRGVIIFTVLNDRVSAVRFYLEPVETSTGDVNAAVRVHLASRP
jgi:ketosteroid isomerase-like protein